MVLLSGGIDSATCLYLSKRRGWQNRALTVQFHRMARGELTAARRLGKAAGVLEHRYLRIPAVRELEDMAQRGRLAGLPPTYIPMKNAIYYSLAAAFAEETGASRIVGGHNREDSITFEDTSDAFFASLEGTLRTGSSRLRRGDLRIWRPLRSKSKAEVVGLADRLGVPLGLTWSCHREGSRHCWKCEGCANRVSSFEEAGVKDPLMPV